MRIAVIGRTEMLLSAAKLLRADGHEIVCVATAKASAESLATEHDFADFARQCGASFLRSSRLGAEAEEVLKTARPELGITMNWPTMIGSHITEIFRFGIVNAHGSDLPKYRGNACPNWAILMNEPVIGLTFHMIDPNGLDTGDIVVKRYLPNNDELYIGDVYSWLGKEIPEGFREVVALVSQADFTAMPQSMESALRSYPRRPSDSRLDFCRDAPFLHRLIRASSRPFPGAFCEYDDGRKVTVWRAELFKLADPILAVPGQILTFDSGGPVVACGSGALRFVEFEPEDSKLLPPSLRARFH